MNVAETVVGIFAGSRWNGQSVYHADGGGICPEANSSYSSHRLAGTPALCYLID